MTTTRAWVRACSSRRSSSSSATIRISDAVTMMHCRGAPTVDDIATRDRDSTIQTTRSSIRRISNFRSPVSTSVFPIAFSRILQLFSRAALISSPPPKCFQFHATLFADIRTARRLQALFCPAAIRVVHREVFADVAPSHARTHARDARAVLHYVHFEHAYSHRR